MLRPLSTGEEIKLSMQSQLLHKNAVGDDTPLFIILLKCSSVKEEDTVIILATLSSIFTLKGLLDLQTK